MRDYELTVVISPSVADDEVTATLEKKVSQFITERGGSITEVKPWGRKKLAYPIKNHNEGNYVLTIFKMDPKLTAELESSLELSEEILRHLLVRLSD
ncbi:MAG: 30S ribosomal protein S6 [Dehalococcoidia bacterium]|nr:30S ribosomal protein S6 [Dehalococcoidia bacterium]